MSILTWELGSTCNKDGSNIKQSARANCSCGGMDFRVVEIESETEHAHWHIHCVRCLTVYCSEIGYQPVGTSALDFREDEHMPPGDARRN